MSERKGWRSKVSWWLALVVCAGAAGLYPMTARGGEEAPTFSVSDEGGAGDSRWEYGYVKYDCVYEPYPWPTKFRVKLYMPTTDQARYRFRYIYTTGVSDKTWTSDSAGVWNVKLYKDGGCVGMMAQGFIGDENGPWSTLTLHWREAADESAPQIAEDMSQSACGR